MQTQVQVQVLVQALVLVRGPARTQALAQGTVQPPLSVVGVPLPPAASPAPPRLCPLPVGPQVAVLVSLSRPSPTPRAPSLFL